MDEVSAVARAFRLRSLAKPLGAVLAGGAMAGILGLMAWALLNQSPVTGESGITRIQKPAPGFTLPLLDEGSLALEDLKGNPVVINFWASWCLPCREEAPGLERTWRAYKDKGVTFVGVDIQDTEQAAAAYIDEFDITYPNGQDLRGRISIDYGVVGIPVTFFIDREGIIARRFVGAINEQQLAAWIDELLSGALPSGDVEQRNPDGYYDLN